MTPELLQRFRSGEPVIGIGLMSGTSADGVDAVVVRLCAPAEQPEVEQLAFLSAPYPDDLRARLHRCFRDEATVSEICELNYQLAARFAEAARQALAAANGADETDFIASHGQTVWHHPPGVAGRTSTLQLGQPAVLSARFDCPVVSDFRAADIVAGGEGAPLVPLVDWLLFAHPERNRAVQNIGGIANVTYLPAGCSVREVIAFDTGPGNALLDLAAARATSGRLRFDEDGRLASQGEVNATALAQLASLTEVAEYLRRPPPKSTGRELFSSALVEGLESAGCHGADLLATLTQFTVDGIVAAYDRFLGPVDEVIVGGGGARNPELMRRLREMLPHSQVLVHEDFGIDGDAKEALAFAVLGYETLRGRAGNLPSATGASRPVILGSVTPPPGG